MAVANLRLRAVASVARSPARNCTRLRRTRLCSRSHQQFYALSALPAVSCFAGAPTSRSYATTTKPRPTRHVAVLGGGLTGLTTAYYLAKHLPTAKITIYESSNRLGGWIDTLKSDVRTEDGSPAQALFERGARSFTPLNAPSRLDPLVVLELAQELDLMQDMITAKPSTRLGQRYVYFPDHLCDVSLPPLNELGPISGLRLLGRLFGRLMSEPLYQDAAKALWHRVKMDDSKETYVEPYDADRMFYDVYGEQQDESLGGFIERIFGGPDIVNNALSALIHGIYGGDVWKLSVASNVFSRPWLLRRIRKEPGQSKLDFGNINDLHMLCDVKANGLVNREMIMSSQDVMSFFKSGFSTLTDAIAKSLKSNPNISFKMNTRVKDIGFDQIWQKVKIKAHKEPTHTSYDKVVSTLFSKRLNDLTKNAIPSLRDEEAVSIQVVNLYYPKPNLNPQGVGYLIPSGIDWQKENPRGALGVLFDSDREALTTPDNQTTGTNLTVMMGGHHWDALDPRDPKEWPSESISIEWAEELVQKHLGIPADETVFASTKKCVECIPQHYVGHRARMAAAHAELEAAFGGRLAVAGGSYTNPGVAPSMRAARDVAMQIAGETQGKEVSDYYPTGHVGTTGLAKFADSARLDCVVNAKLWMAKYLPDWK